MSEHKTKKPGEYKGLEYRRTQRMPVRARWVKLEKIKPTDHKWARRHGLEIKDRDQAELTKPKKNDIKGGTDESSH